MTRVDNEPDDWYEMTFICPKCGSAWHDEWDSVVENDCPHESCGQKHVTESSYQKLKGAINV